MYRNFLSLDSLFDLLFLHFIYFFILWYICVTVRLGIAEPDRADAHRVFEYLGEIILAGEA